MSERMTEEELAKAIRRARNVSGGSRNGLEQEVERARASEATLTSQLRARDEALRVAREALGKVKTQMRWHGAGDKMVGPGSLLAEVTIALAAPTKIACTCEMDTGPCGCEFTQPSPTIYSQEQLQKAVEAAQRAVDDSLRYESTATDCVERAFWDTLAAIEEAGK